MPVSRMRMRPWLENIIDSNTIPGLHWLDKDKTMFSVPWKHAARHGWDLIKDASLFKEWAIHTGKYAEGQVSDPKTWKANFRCAMNSLPDIEEVKDKSVNKGQQAVRVFRLLPVTHKGKDKRNRTVKRRRSTKVKYEEESSDSDCVPSPVQNSHFPSPQDSRVDSTVQPEPHVYGLPEWSVLEEVGFSSQRHFQVSPSHTHIPDDNDIIEICAQLESERHWMSCSLSSNGFLNNELPSPGSQFSETSSVDELDEHPKYTTLDSTFPSNDYSLYPFCEH